MFLAVPIYCLTLSSQCPADILWLLMQPASAHTFMTRYLPLHATRLASFIMVCLLSQPGAAQTTENLRTSDSLYAVAMACYEAGQVAEATALFCQSDTLDRQLWKEGDPRRDYAAWWAAHCLCQLGDTAQAKEHHVDNYYITPPDRRLLAKADSLLAAVGEMAEKGDFAGALRLCLEAAGEAEQAVGKDHFANITYLDQVCSYYYYTDDFPKAAEAGEQALALCRETAGKRHPSYALLLSNLCIIYEAMSDLPKAIRAGEECMEAALISLGSDNPAFYYVLSSTGNLYASVGNYREAARIGEQAVEVVAANDMQTELVIAKSNLSYYYALSGHCAEALQAGREAVDLAAKVLGREHADYAYVLHNLAIVEEKMGLYYEAKTHFEEVLELRKQNASPHTYAQTLIKVASLTAEMGSYEEGIRMGKDALDCLEQAIGTSSIHYADALNSLSLIYSDYGDYAEALKLNQQASNLAAQILGKDHPNYALTLNNLATILYAQGDYSEALQVALEAHNIMKNSVGPEHHSYGLTLSSIASILSEMNEFERALQYQREAADIALRTNGEISPQYIARIGNIARCYACLGQPDSALALGEQVLQLRERSLGKNHPDYVDALSAVASYRAGIGDYEEAQRIEEEAVRQTEHLLGKTHPAYSKMLQRLAIFQYLAEGSPATGNVEEASRQCLRFLTYSFADMGVRSRRLFWQQYRPWFENWAHRFAQNTSSDTLIANAYNAALVSKGLLLCTELAFQTLIRESENEEAIDTYQRWILLRRIIEQQQGFTREERTADLDSLIDRAHEEERHLLSLSKDFGSFLNYTKIRWQDVAAELKENEVAIEFVAFPDRENKVQYAAYSLRGPNGKPQLTPLCSEEAILSLDKADLYTTDSLTRLIWEPLRPVIEGVTTVYFSPAGELHNLAIEWLPQTGERYTEGQPHALVCDETRLIRLSSTRELVTSQTPDDIRNTPPDATIFGGIAYDSSTLSLPASREEAERVAEIVAEACGEATLLCDTLATEDALLRLSGQSTPLLHFSTHGFYWPHAARDTGTPPDLLSDHSDEDALRFSGLLFSGANAIPSPDNLSGYSYQGVLRAKDISFLDLRNTCLTVLSTCRSGLGEVTGDGVFGLQRGFKKAGAHTLLMSLWDISDQATALLMGQFYLALTRDKEPYEALRSAQQYLRQETPYSHPAYWAGFILLDPA